MATHLDINEEQLNILIELYAEVDCTLDDLPYNATFDRLCINFQQRSNVVLSQNYIWEALCNARKAKKLVRKAIAGSDDSHEIRIVNAKIADLRSQLKYLEKKGIESQSQWKLLINIDALQDQVAKLTDD